MSGEQMSYIHTPRTLRRRILRTADRAALSGAPPRRFRQLLKKYAANSLLTEHLEDGFARLGDACGRHERDPGRARGAGTCRLRRRGVGDRRRRLLLLLLLAVTGGGDRGATQRDADADVENRNENHRQNEEQECRDLSIETDARTDRTVH